MNYKQYIKEHVTLLTEAMFRVVDKETFNDALLNLSTLDLEDDQIGFPRTQNRKQSYLDGGNEYNLILLDKEELAVQGPFEILIKDDDDNIIGFIRGTKSNNIISFNMVFIKPDNRGRGIGRDIYAWYYNSGLIIKSDSEITNDTYSMYDRLVSYGFQPIIFPDNTVGLKK